MKDAKFELNYRTGVTLRVASLMAFSWIFFAILGVSTALSAKAMELLVESLRSQTFSFSVVLIYSCLVLVSPVAIFLSRIISSKCSLLHLQSIHRQILDFLGTRCPYSENKIDHESIYLRLMNEGAAIVSPWQSVVGTCISTLVALGTACFIIPGLDIVILCVILFAALVSILISKKMSHLVAQSWKVNMDSVASYHRIIKQRNSPGFNEPIYSAQCQEWANSRVEEKGNHYFLTSFKQLFLSASLSLFSGLMSLLPSVTILFWTLFFRSGYEIGQLIATISFATAIMGPLTGIGDVFEEIERWRKAKNGLETQFSVPQDSSKLISSFLDNLPENGLIRIKGPSGIGKTKFIKDEVLWPLASEGRKVAYLPQDPSFIDGTAFENVICGSAPSCQVGAMMDLVGLSSEKGIDWLRDYELDASNLPLSVGQARRLAIVRVLLSEADVFVLDEPYAGLDLKNINILKTIFLELSRTSLVFEVSHGDLDPSRYAKVIDIRKERLSNASA